MAWRNTKTDTGKRLTLRPIMPGGADYFRDASVLPPEIASQSENLDTTTGTVDRRLGAVKLSRLATPGTTGASRTFAATTKYATFSPAAIPSGGFVVHLPGFVATRPASGKTGWIVGSRPAGQTFHILSVTISDAGVVAVTWHDSSGSDQTIACDAVAAGATVHLLAVFDAYAGTFTVYVNGAVSGTPVTGLPPALKPDATAATWAFGVMKQTGQAVTADTNFDGAFDGMTIHTLRGTRATSVALVETLRRHSARVFPNADADHVLAHYDMDEASGTTMYDRSDNKNHGTYVGGPSVTSPVALLSAPCNMIARMAVPAGAWNLVAQFGALFYERTQEAVA